MTRNLIEAPAPGAPEFRFEHHDTVGSTNSLCFERAGTGHPGNLWIRADEQTGGRGRRGREWSSPAGNMFASLLLVDPHPKDRIGELPLVTAVALAEAVDKAAGTLQLVDLKWPNDLLINNAKLSGILLEAETMSDGRLAVVLGIGVNCAAHPPLTLYDATDLRSLGYHVTADRMFECLASEMSEALAIWQQADGFQTFRKAWLQRAAKLGEEITVRSGEHSVTGLFADLDSKGHLVLKLDDGTTKTIYAGDVFLSGQ